MSNITNLLPCRLSSRDVNFATNILELLAAIFEKSPNEYSNGRDAAEEARSMIMVIKEMGGVKNEMRT